MFDFAIPPGYYSADCKIINKVRGMEHSAEHLSLAQLGGRKVVSERSNAQIEYGEESKMPIFEFRCLKCGNVSEKILVKSDETIVMECTECKSDELERIVSRTNHVMARGSGEQPKITARSCGSGGSCMSVDIPGPTK